MENKGLLFIPDISGFTRFVNQTEIEHSRLIIQELLEIIIASNQIGLQVSEIEGDAILFYKFGEPPSLEEMYAQVERMFCEFHKSLLAYDDRRYCQCNACIKAVDLTLKVITHYGEFTGYNVQQFHKLIGKDIIVAHQLLKNDIDQHEYWLITKQLVAGDEPKMITDWMQWNTSTKQTENGTVDFHFTQLSPLKGNVKLDEVPQIDLSRLKKMVSVTKSFATDMITLFHATGDFNHRSSWMEGVKKVEELNHYLPRVGMKAITFLDNGQSVIYSSSYYWNEKHIEFSETEEQTQSVMYFTIDSIDEANTILRIDLYRKKNFVANILFNVYEKKRTTGKLVTSLNKLQTFLQTFHYLDAMDKVQ